MCGGPLKCGGPCSAEHVRTLVNPALVNSALFFNSCYFHNVGFSIVVCPRCAPELEGTTQIGGPR